MPLYLGHMETLLADCEQCQLSAVSRKNRSSWLHISDSHCYRGADKSLARPTSRCILFDGENISFDSSLVIFINSTNIPPIMIINRIYREFHYFRA